MDGRKHYVKWNNLTQKKTNTTHSKLYVKAQKKADTKIKNGGDEALRRVRGQRQYSSWYRVTVE